MSADDSAPAATSWKIRSGNRNAAKNASRSPAAQNGVGDDHEADPAEHARDEERAGDDSPARAMAWPAVTGRGRAGPVDGPPDRRPGIDRARRGCRSGSSPGSRGRAAPGRRAGRRRRRAGASRTSGGGCAARPRPAALPARQAVEAVAQAAHAERAAEVVQEDSTGGGSSPGSPTLEQDRPAVREVVGERLASRPSQQPDPLLAALAQDPDLATPEVEGSERRARPAR